MLSSLAECVLAAVMLKDNDEITIAAKKRGRFPIPESTPSHHLLAVAGLLGELMHHFILILVAGTALAHPFRELEGRLVVANAHLHQATL